MLRRLPSSPSRSQALIDFEPVLLKYFQNQTIHVEREVRDSMHYVLFSVGDRFCASTAWLIAPRLGISTERMAALACAVETLRCAQEMKPRASAHTSALEPTLLDTAVLGLIPLAFELALTASSPLSALDRAAAAVVLAKAASPSHFVKEQNPSSLSRIELLKLCQEKVSPAFQAIGEIFELLAQPATEPGRLSFWFKRLGLFALWIDEFMTNSQSPLSLTQNMALPEAMDLVKSLEGELLLRAKELNILGAAHEIIEPLADVLKTQLQ